MLNASSVIFLDENKGRIFNFKREIAFGLFSLSFISLRSISEREKSNSVAFTN